MPPPLVHTDITLDMLILEMERQERYYEKNYKNPDNLRKGKITSYERDFRININKKILSLLYQAKANKQQINQPKLLDILTTLP